MKHFLFGLLLALAAQSSHAATTIALQRVVNDVVTNYTDPQRGTNGAAWTYQAYRQAGERNEDSTTGTDYMSTSEECKTSAIIDLSSDASTTVYNGPAILNWAYLSVTIGTEAATIDDNTTAKLNLPVSLAVGVHPFKGARFDTSLVVNPGTTSTGTLTLCYRPLDSSQVTY